MIDRHALRAPVNVRTVFLDFGGTLAEPLLDLRPCVRAAARRSGVRVQSERFLTESERSWERLWPEAPSWLGRRPSFADMVHERALRAAGAEGPIDAMVGALREELLAPRRHRPYPETDEVLRTLQQKGHRLHVVSNHTDYLPEILRRLGWAERFSGISFSQEVGAEKPDPRLFTLALSRSACPPEQAVHVGDQWEADYLGARRVGIRAIWLNRTASPTPGPADSIQDLRGLLELSPAA